MHRTVEGISTRSGLTHTNPLEGVRFSGTYKHAAHLASGKYAIIENAKEFVFGHGSQALKSSEANPSPTVAD